MKEMGKILKEKRENLGLDLSKVHRATKIQEKYISAIEEGDNTVFLAEIYYKSFVKSYSKFLGLNGEDLLLQYEKRKCSSSENDASSVNTAGTDKNKCKQSAEKHKSGKESDLKKLFITVLIAVILCAAFLYLNKNISIFIDESSDKISAIEQKKIRLQQLQELQEQKDRELKERQLREVSVESQEKIVEENKSKMLTPFPQKQESKAHQPEKTVTASAASSAASEHSSAASSVATQNEKQDLEIVAVENVWIKVEGDGRELFQGTIVKGTKKTWKANDDFVVKIGYTPGVDVFFNGTEVDIDKGAVQDVNTLVLKRQP